MKRKIFPMLLILGLLIVLVYVYTTKTRTSDEGQAKEFFSFVKDKIKDDALDSEEGILEVIEEGKEKFGIEISKEDAGKLVGAMEQLQDLGFSAEDVVDEAEKLYQQYGADFADHAEEAITGAVKNAAENAASGFFEGLKLSVKNFFDSLFS